MNNGHISIQTIQRCTTHLTALTATHRLTSGVLAHNHSPPFPPATSMTHAHCCQSTRMHLENINCFLKRESCSHCETRRLHPYMKIDM